MKVKVMKEFIDIHTKELHKVGDSFACDSDRFNEIEMSGHYVVPIEEKKPEKAEKTIKEKVTE